MTQEERSERLRLLGLLSGAGEDLRSLVDRHSILLGKLAADPYIGSILFGMESANIGEIVVARSTSNLTLTQTAQSITGDGDSSKVRLILPTIGDWLVEATADFIVDADDPGTLKAELFVGDSASGETGLVLFKAVATMAGTFSQQWKVVTTSVKTPVELKGYKDNAGGTARMIASHTVLVATRTR